MTFGSSLGPDNILGRGGHTGHSDWDGSDGMQHSPQKPPRPQVLAPIPGFCANFDENTGL